MKKIKFNSELNALQFSNRVNGVQNYVNGKWEVEFSNNVNTSQIENNVGISENKLSKAAKILGVGRKPFKSYYTIKGYNELDDFIRTYGEYESFEEAENDLDNAQYRMGSGCVKILEIVKLYKRK